LRNFQRPLLSLALLLLFCCCCSSWESNHLLSVVRRVSRSYPSLISRWRQNLIFLLFSFLIFPFYLLSERCPKRRPLSAAK
jgi:hypothetical protein